MKDSKTPTQDQQHLKTIPRKYWIIAGVIFSLVLVYALIFFIPKKVEFSYAGETCAKQLVLFPGAQSKNSDNFELTVKDELKIGGFAYAATKVCVQPKNAPQQGSYAASIGLFGGWFASKQFDVQVGEAPTVLANSVLNSAISAALPLKVELTAPDIVHEYSLQVAERRAPCGHKDKQLVCEVAPLALAPGAEYTIAVSRTFNDTNATKVVEGKVAT